MRISVLILHATPSIPTSDRNEDEIMILRATASVSDECIPHQIDNSSDTVAGLSIAMANTLDKQAGRRVRNA